MVSITESIVAELNSNIDALTTARDAILASSNGHSGVFKQRNKPGRKVGRPASVSGTTTRKSTMSAAARKRIGAAQRKRWAEQKRKERAEAKAKA